MIEFVIAGFVICKFLLLLISRLFGNFRINENMPADIEIKFSGDSFKVVFSCFRENGCRIDGTNELVEEYYTDSCGNYFNRIFNNLNNLEDLYLPRNPELTGILPAGLLEVYNSGNLYVSASDSPNFSPDGIMLSVDNNLIMAPAEGGIYFVEVRSNAEWTCEVLWAEYVH
ncbi:MAG: hypothetical protein ACLUDU_18495, partial [Butyricimonas faecihominis]